MHPNDLTELTLGKSLPYTEHYDASLLQPISRQLSRQHLPVNVFVGQDIWTAYELSWLSPGGKPQVAIAEFVVPANSTCIIESKSFKYYLNSFNQTEFDSRGTVVETLQNDLSKAAGAAVAVTLYSLADFTAKRAATAALGNSLDEESPLSLSAELKPSVDLLQVRSQAFDGVWRSHLLKSNCPVTGQPDWASIWLGWTGRAVEPASLLAYIIAYRRHQDFHENCVESMYCDLAQVLQPERLWVYARYTRRGGLDINPFRSSEPMSVPAVFGERQ